MKPTTEQRREIYLSVANQIENSTSIDNHLCCVLKNILEQEYSVTYNEIDIKYLKVYLPEFMLFEQPKFVWFDYTDYKNPDEGRIICMLLCAEMCKPWE